ncbi:MAG: hypothetical protein M4579_005696 [Chaenotheca gracillima]|nr:MAG: hypothetical protein M4579_005696 [Chaenotheca gracillima]
MFQFTPLLGAQSDSPASQSLLELDGGVKILVDCGWDEKFDPEDLREIERHVPTLSIILLTHATTAHLAAFAHCCKHFPLFTRIPVYATSPVISFGRTLLQDLYASTPLASTVIPKSSLSETSLSYSASKDDASSSNILLQPPTADEIATYFSLINPLKFLQPHQPLGSPFASLNGLTITAYNAGHTLGGTIWHIQHGLESIIYAVDWNQARENVLSGAAWLGGAGAGGAEVVEELRKPTALVCSSRGAEGVAQFGRKKRDDLLLEMVRSTAAKGGTVLIPTDTSARMLELTYLLEHAWRSDSKKMGQDKQRKDDKTMLPKLYLAGRNVGTTIRYAKSMVEWMDDSIGRGMDGEDTGQGGQQPGRTNTNTNRHGNDPRRGGGNDQQESESTGPFDLKFVKLLERKKQIARVLNEDQVTGQNRGKVILASDTSLEWGFSKDILRQIAADDRNLIILTQMKSGKRTGPAKELWDWWAAASGDVKSDIERINLAPGDGRELCFQDAERAALEGNDLMVYQQYLATQRQLQNTIQSSNDMTAATAADAVDDESSSSSSSSDASDPERQGKALNVSATLTHSNRNKLGLSNEDLGINVLLRRKGIYDFDTRGKKGRERMFPYVTKRRRGDDFGEMIRPEEYLKAEEREEAEGQDQQASIPNEKESTLALGKKRNWDNAGLLEVVGGRRSSSGGGKRRPDANRRFGAAGDASTAGAGGLALQGAIKDDDSSDESEAEGDGLRNVDQPSKAVFKQERVPIKLNIAFIDFDGLHDKRSLQMLIPLIQPRKLILVHGMKNETALLSEDCRKLLNARVSGSDGGSKVDVFAPDVGVMVDASVDTSAWTVKLSESLVKRLQWQKVRSLGVVHVMGLLDVVPAQDETESSQGRNKKLKNSVSEDVTKADTTKPSPDTRTDSGRMVPVLDVLPSNVAAGTRSAAQPLHVGDLRLADLRKILQGAGHTAEFRGEGTLLVDGIVAVRKSGTGRIEIEAGGVDAPNQSARARGIEGSFHTVRRKIYEGLAVVAGG